MPLTTIKSSNIGTGAISSSDLDTTYLTPTGDGSSLTGVDSGLQSVQVFTTSGTWTKPSGISKVLIEVQGAGGSGCMSYTDYNNYMHGGVAGGYAIKLLDVSSISSSTITVGSGGAGVTSTGAGNSGGNSSWVDGSNTITGNGGSGGGTGFRTGSAGASASGGDINIPSAGTSVNNGSTSNSGSKWGNQGALDMTGYTAYPDATGYGAGGGARWGNSGTSGAGGDGIVIVWEYK